MKFLLIAAFLFFAGAYARSTVKEVVDGPKCELKDPHMTEANKLNVSLVPILLIEERADSTHDGATFIGLSTLKYQYEILPLALTAKVDLTLGSIMVDVDYNNIVGWVDCTPLSQETLPTGNFTGSGHAHIEAKNVNLKAKATLFINLLGNKVGLLTLDIEALTFESLSGSLGPDFLLDGKPIDWAAWSASFKVNFEREFAANKPAVTEKLRLTINAKIGVYTIEELIKLIEDIGTGGDGECDTLKIAL